MKVSILLFLVLLSANSLGSTFVAQNTIQTSLSNYLQPKVFEISVLSLNTSDKKISFKVNGRTVTQKYTVSSRQMYEMNFNIVLKNDVLQEGWGCEESEEITYFAKINVEDDRDPHSEREVSITSVYAVRSYSWDVCHDQNPETEKFKYIMQ